jgi:hypothetical protein
MVIEHIEGYNGDGGECGPGWHRVSSVAHGGDGRHSRGTIDTIAEVAFRFEKKIFFKVGHQANKTK